MKYHKTSALIGTFLMMLLACMLGACSTSQTTDTSSTLSPILKSSTSTIKAIRMLDHANGWALTDQSILATSDGGQDWKNVTPSGSIYGKYAYGDFINDQSAWVVSTAQPIDNSVNVLHTSDGGKYWQSSKISVSEVSLLEPPHFLTTKAGFLELTIGKGIGSQQAVGIFHTTDGGQYWTEISNIGITNATEAVSYKTGITLKDAYTGWATGGGASAKPLLYVTHDGGHTWNKQSLPNIPGSIDTTTTPPVFFGNIGFLPAEIVVSGIAQGHVMAAWKTTDGGATWTVTKPGNPSGSSKTGFVTGDDLYISDVNHAWGTDPAGDMWGTKDGFKNWSLLAPSFDFINALSFVDSSYGWAISNTKLWHTTDGGYHWNEITYHITA